jgi:ADP-heptose:LPS heptosyltransferase
MHRPLDVAHVERILIMQLQQLGDSVVFTPTLRAIRRRFPKANITILASPISFELYKKSEHIDEIVIMPPPSRRPWSWLVMFRGLRRRRFDLAIADVTQLSMKYGVLASFSGARQRIGFESNHRGFLYTTRLKCPDGLSFLDCNLEIARVLGADDNDKHVECPFDTADSDYVESLLSSSGLDGPRVVMHVASNWQSKTWDSERWANLAQRLIEERGCSIIFVGTKAERDYIAAIESRVGVKTLSLVGQTDLCQLAALLTKCDLFVGTDSGPRHLAAASGCRQVTVMSSQDRPTRWVFDRQSEVVLRTDPGCSPCFKSYCSHRLCMMSIDTSAVFEACIRQIDRPTSEAGARASRVNTAVLGLQ